MQIEKYKQEITHTYKQEERLGKQEEIKLPKVLTFLFRIYFPLAKHRALLAQAIEQETLWYDEFLSAYRVNKVWKEGRLIITAGEHQNACPIYTVYKNTRLFQNIAFIYAFDKYCHGLYLNSLHGYSQATIASRVVRALLIATTPQLKQNTAS